MLTTREGSALAQGPGAGAELGCFGGARRMATTTGTQLTLSKEGLSDQGNLVGARGSQPLGCRQGGSVACGVQGRGRSPPCIQKSPELQRGICPSGLPSYLSAAFFWFQVSSRVPFLLSARLSCHSPAPPRRGCHAAESPLGFSPIPFPAPPFPIFFLLPNSSLQPGSSLGPCPVPYLHLLWSCSLEVRPHPYLLGCGEGPAVLKRGLWALLHY